MSNIPDISGGRPPLSQGQMLALIQSGAIPQVIEHITSEVMKRVTDGFRQELQDQWRHQLARGESTVQQLGVIERQASQRQIAFDQVMDDTRRAIEQRASQATQDVAKSVEDVVRHMKEAQADFVNNIMKEVAGVDALHDYWGKEEQSFKTQVIVYFSLLTAVMGGCFALAEWQIPKQTIDLTHVSSAISVGACATLAIWAISLLCRLGLSSLLSLRDARHKLAAMRTFVDMRHRGQLGSESGDKLFNFLLLQRPSGLLKGAEHPYFSVLRDAAQQVTKIRGGEKQKP